MLYMTCDGEGGAHDINAAIARADRASARDRLATTYGEALAVHAYRHAAAVFYTLFPDGNPGAVETTIALTHECRGSFMDAA